MFQTIHVDSEHISGITASSNAEYNNLFLPDYIDIPTVGSSSWNLDTEAILNQHPDVVFLNRGSQVDPISDELESMNIPVLRFYGGTYSMDIEKEVKAFGYLFDKRDEADKFIDWYESFMTSINTTVSKIPDEDRPKVWFESSHKKYYGFNENLVDFAGGKNILPGGGDIDPEAVVGFDPDVIIIAAGCTGGYFLDADNVTAIKKLRDEMMSRRELQNVSAVKNGRVYAINGYMLGSMSCSSGRSFLQVPYLAAWFYPDLFKDLDPQAIHQEYLTKFRGLNYDLDKEGVFVYPPLEES
jgi:iron complex transport system substrate-binding protein